MAFSDRALKLIVDFEGMNQPGKWPGAVSGITLGYGYDLGHVTAAQFARDWAGAFSAEQMSRLATAIGITGAAAQAIAGRFADIRCPVEPSRRVLLEASIPTYTATTRAAFPGFDALPLDAQGALVSLVYNRGGGMQDAPGRDNRREMRAIRDCVARGDLAGIAAQLRSMKRLWAGQGLDGLLRRRDAEAALVESCLAPVMRSMRGIAPAEKKAATRRPAAKKRAARKTAGKRATAKKPAVKKSVAKKPAVKKSVAKKPAAKKPVAKKAVAKKAVAKKAVAKKPAAKKAVAKKAVAKKSAAKKPVAKKPTAKKPTAKKPTAKGPAAKKRGA